MSDQAIEIASRSGADGQSRVGVDYLWSAGHHQFWMWEGHGQHAMSTPCTAAEVLAQWQSHLAEAGALGLLPWLRRIAAGEVIDPAEILAARSQGASPR